VIVHSQSWSKRSIMGALVYRHDGTPARMTFEIIPNSYDLRAIVRWAWKLIRLMRGQPAFLVWDRLQAHRNHAVRALLAAHAITVVLLPAYSPQLNPVEWMWANLKNSELANLCPEDIGHAATEARRGMERIRRRPTLMQGFLTGAKLFFGSKCQSD
jgi:hypothetical protein